MQSTKYWTLVGPRLVPPCPFKKRPPSIAIIISKKKEKGKPIQSMNASTNHNLSHSNIWQLLLILIHRGPSSPHICYLLSPHLWYQYLEIEIFCTLCCVGLLLPSWLMYPNNSFKAFIRYLELGQICNSIHPWEKI